MFIVLVNYYQDTGDERFKRYAADGGRYIFQIDLGIALLNYGIREDWPLSNDEIWGLTKRPRWMWSKDVIPCNCAGPAKCFFCSEGITNGVHHDSASILQVPERRESLMSNVRIYAGLSRITKEVNHANNVRVNRKDRKDFIQQWDAQGVINQFANIAGKMDIKMIIIGHYRRQN